MKNLRVRSVMSTPAQLLDFFQSRLNESLDTLRQLVEMESHSHDKPGIDALAEFLAAEFSSLGAEVEIFPDRARGNALKAHWRTDTGRKPLLLLGHLDTVWPRGTALMRPFRVEGGSAFGPGVFDMKSGILLSLLACRALNEEIVKPGSDVIFLFTADEEIGTETGRPHLTASAPGCGAVLCLEPPLPGGRAKTFRKGVGTWRLRVRGVSAHAGVDHAKGANAIVELSRQLIRVQEMTDYSRGVTVSVGRFQGGTASNVVPDDAEAIVDFRVSAIADGQHLESLVRNLQPVDPRCTLTVEGGLNRPPLERTEAVIALFQKARNLAMELGMDLGEGSTGGGSDGSFTAAMGIPTLDGLGVDGDGAHAADEHICVNDIPPRAALLCRLVETIFE